MTHALEFKNVSHAFDDHQVARNISFHLGKGEIVCLLGPSGCGKTTLLRLAAGLEKLQSGCIEIDGKVVADGHAKNFVPPEKRHVGLVFQDFALFPHMDVMQNAVFGIDPKDAGRVSWIEKMMGNLGLADKRHSYPHQLSGGEKQRVALLRALAPNPRVLFLDEPFSALDTTRRLQIREDTVHLLKDEGISAMMVTHDPEEAMFMSDRILVMKDGHIIQNAPSAEVFLHPKNSFVAKLFGPANRFESIVRNGKASTPLGDFSAGSLLDGTAVEILIRPEAVTAESSDNEQHSAEVLDNHFLGHSSCMHVNVISPADGKTYEIRTRARHGNPLSIGDKASLDIDENHVFVFEL